MSDLMIYMSRGEYCVSVGRGTDSANDLEEEEMYHTSNTTVMCSLTATCMNDTNHFYLAIIGVPHHSMMRQALQ